MRRLSLEPFVRVVLHSACVVNRMVLRFTEDCHITESE